MAELDCHQLPTVVTAQVPPQFSSSYNNDYYEYFRECLIIPKDFPREIITIVEVKFIIGCDGETTLTYIQARGSSHHGLITEISAAINNMPPWKPGRNKGHNVKVREHLSFTIVEGKLVEIDDHL
ncbi:MAG: hypothetical protein WD077_00595 [Bacteroidia bacterium]